MLIGPTRAAILYPQAVHDALDGLGKIRDDIFPDSPTANDDDDYCESLNTQISQMRLVIAMLQAQGYYNIELITQLNELEKHYQEVCNEFF